MVRANPITPFSRFAATRSPTLIVRLASPRGFCAGVERAVLTVEKTLKEYGAPVYVRHEIVHNRHVVERLAKMGAIFIEDLADADDDRPIVFSAHGAPKSAHADARARNLLKIDATCPLVHKVHAQTRRYVATGHHVYLIGHDGHPEVIGTTGQVPVGTVTLIESIHDIAHLPDHDGAKAYVTQTTLSVDETSDIIAALKERFPDIVAPQKEDICYATSNRQNAVKAIAPGTDLFVVIGSGTSSNSKQLVDTARKSGATRAVLVEDCNAFDFAMLEHVSVLGLSAGASAPENLVEEFLSALTDHKKIEIDTITTTDENISFNLPLPLAG